MTLNFVRALVDGGFADLHHPENWDLAFVKHSPLAAEYQRMVDAIGESLRFMETLREWSGRPVGYSGHDTGTAISLAAVAMGARMLERHLTLDRSMRGPDHKASLEPAQFAEQVRAVRDVEASLGAPHRWLTRGETLNRRTLSKSLVAATSIGAGTPITRAMIVSKSPGLGLSPQFVDRLVGRTLDRDLAQQPRLGELVERVVDRRGRALRPQERRSWCQRAGR